MVTTSELKFAYDPQNSFSFPELNCAQGSQWLITGPSGCGKSTLLHLLAGLLKPTSGQITIAGNLISSLRPAQIDKIRGKTIGIIFQKPYFVASLTVAENLKLVRSLNLFKESNSQIKELLRELNIQDKFDSRTHELSQGELQRLSIARALINNPKLILADEPTSSLDDHHCTEALRLLKQQAKANNATLLIITHDQRVKSEFTNIIQLEKVKQ